MFLILVFCCYILVVRQGNAANKATCDVVFHKIILGLEV